MSEVFLKFLSSTGFSNMSLNEGIMILVACVLIYLAVAHNFEPLLLMPIAFGMLLANLPLSGVMAAPLTSLQLSPIDSPETAKMAQEGKMFASMLTNAPGGLLYYLNYGVKLGIFPPLIFLGVGAMTDFSPLIANPKSLLLGAAAQFGIFITFLGALALGMTAQEAASTGIIGGADGPTAIFTTTLLAPHLLGPIAVAAYSYMALVPIIQPPIMRALTTKEERLIVMEQLREVSHTEKVIFPVLVTVLVSLVLPSAAVLIGMLMFGNLLRESGVTDRLAKTASNEMINIITVLLGLCVGATTNGQTFLTPTTLKILLLGVIAFAVGTGSGVLLARFINLFSKHKINPLIGSAGVSAVPMAARVSNKVGQEENPGNFLLMHAMGPNVAGVIGSAVAAGILINFFR